MLLRRLLAAAGIGIATVGLPAQTQAPATEVYLAPLQTVAGAATLGPWTNVSNSPGYDNQPSFLPDNSGVLFSSNRDGKQMDIHRYDIASRTLSQVTSTPEGEYSPVVTPDRRTFSVIRVEADKTQRLWRFDLDGSNPRVILENVKPVGYHAWIDETHLALFVLGSPATLQLADTKTGTATLAETGIGRSMCSRESADPSRTVGSVAYIATGPPRTIKTVTGLGQLQALFPPLEGSQDMACWGTSFLMANGTQISVRHHVEGANAGWDTFADLSKPAGSSPAVASITRLAVSPDGKWLAFVAEPAAK